MKKVSNLHNNDINFPNHLKLSYFCGVPDADTQHWMLATVPVYFPQPQIFFPDTLYWLIVVLQADPLCFSYRSGSCVVRPMTRRPASNLRYYIYTSSGCGSEYIELGSGSWILPQFGSGFVYQFLKKNLKNSKEKQFVYKNILFKKLLKNNVTGISGRNF